MAVNPAAMEQQTKHQFKKRTLYNAKMCDYWYGEVHQVYSYTS
jgi:hypothetical protein